MNKALIITTTSGFLSQFELNNVRLLQEKGYQVHYATNFGVPIYEVKDETLRNMGVVLHHISIEKNPFKIKRIYGIAGTYTDYRPRSDQCCPLS